MLKKTYTYTDYFGTERTEDFYFNYTKAEITERELSKEGGLANVLTSIVNAVSAPDLMSQWKTFIIGAYGVRSEDGRAFMKTPEIQKTFECSPVYDILFRELTSDSKAAADFVNAVIPEHKAASETATATPTLVQ